MYKMLHKINDDFNKLMDFKILTLNTELVGQFECFVSVWVCMCFCVFHLLGHWFVVKGHNSATFSVGRDAQGQAWGQAWGIHALQCTTLPGSSVFTNLEVLQCV